MKLFHKTLVRALGVASITLASGMTLAESNRWVCQPVGYAGATAAEPLGDREGHAIYVGEYSCRIDGGTLGGGIATGTNMLEWDKGTAALLSGQGIIRKPDATLTYQNSGMKHAPTIADGKVTGFAGTGQGRITMATGAASALSGKNYSFTYKSIDAGQFVVDMKYE
jgi:hypothetical protein